ncbi:hypothetical protein [Deinococcus altitudinis]|uniref:hypothetical protein n=1 Tax=Deinococcus altitudinis TaxID=468914 RepID=UPI003892B3C0
MQLVSVWSDLYASTLALYSGRVGGHRWLIAVTPAQAETVAQTLGELEGKGETVLLVYADLTPLEAALRGQTDAGLGRGLAGVVVVGLDLTGGPAVTVPAFTRQAEPGELGYQEGGSYPAWTDALGAEGERGECAAASVCAGLGLPVRVCAPQTLSSVLSEWWAATPHALTATD